MKTLKIPINYEVTAYYKDNLGCNINLFHPGLRLLIYTEFYQEPLSITEIEMGKEMIKEFTKVKLFKYKIEKNRLLFWELYKRRLWPNIYKEEANNED